MPPMRAGQVWQTAAPAPAYTKSLAPGRGPIVHWKSAARSCGSVLNAKLVPVGSVFQELLQEVTRC